MSWIVLLALALAAPIAPGLLAAGPPADRPLVVTVGADVDSFNEYVAASTLAFDLADQLFLTLMEEGAPATGEIPLTPRLARSWIVSPDGLTVTFTLRDDVRWSDGRPTTSADVLFTWQAQTDPALGWPDAELKANIASVEAPDPRTAIFRLKRRTPWALPEINEGHILPRHALEGIPRGRWRETDFSRGLVTNGPYRLASWIPGQSIELSRNPDYFEKGMPRIGRVVFRIVTDPAIRMRQAFAGETDVLEGVPPETATTVSTDRVLKLERVDQRMYAYVCWNNRRAPFDDVRVRRALTSALDRDEMLRVLARGMGRPSAGPIVSSLAGGARAPAPIPFDPAAARALLKEAGWEDRDADGTLEKEGRPFRIELEFNRGNTLRENLSLRIAAQLAEIGVKAVPRGIEWAAFQSKHREGDFDAFVASRIVPTRISFETFVSGDPANYAGYANPELDALASRAEAAGTLAEARPLWEKAQEIVARDQPVTFLFEQDRLYAVSRRLSGIEAGPLGIFASLRKWRFGPKGAATPAPE